MKAHIYITLKHGVLDPQGKATEHALSNLGLNAQDVRIGKYITLELQHTSKEDAEAAVKAMCEQLLANTVIENYRFTLETA